MTITVLKKQLERKADKLSAIEKEVVKNKISTLEELSVELKEKEPNYIGGQNFPKYGEVFFNISANQCISNYKALNFVDARKVWGLGTVNSSPKDVFYFFYTTGKKAKNGDYIFFESLAFSEKVIKKVIKEVKKETGKR